MIPISCLRQAGSVFISLSALCSVGAYFSWGNGVWVYYALASLGIMLGGTLIIIKSRISFRSLSALSFLFFGVLLYSFWLLKLPNWVGFSFLLICVLTLSDKEFIFSCYLNFKWFYTAICIVGLVFYVLLALGIPLPFFSVVPPNELKGALGLHYDNYIVFVVLSNQYFDAFGFNFHRLHLIFDEPGVVGTLSAFLLTCNWYSNTRSKENYVFGLSGLFSFSFAFIVLVGLYLSISFLLGRRFKLLLIFVIFIVSGLCVVNIFDTLQNPLLERFVFSSDSFLKNNRGLTFEIFSGSHRLDFNETLFGVGEGYSREIDPGGSSIIHFILDYGWSIVFFWFSFVFLFSCRFVRFVNMEFSSVIPLFAVFLASMYQRPMFFSFIYLLLFVGPLICMAKLDGPKDVAVAVAVA